MDLETLNCKMQTLDERPFNDLGERLTYAKQFHYLAQGRGLSPN